MGGGHIDSKMMRHHKSLVNRIPLKKKGKRSHGCSLPPAPPTRAPLNHMSALVYNPAREGDVRGDDVRGSRRAEGALLPDRGMRGQRCRSDLRVNHKPGRRRVQLLCYYNGARKHANRRGFLRHGHRLL